MNNRHSFKFCNRFTLIHQEVGLFQITTFFPFQQVITTILTTRKNKKLEKQQHFLD